MSKNGLDIGFLCQGWYPDVGGVESHTRDLARELSLRGHRVRALCLDYTEGREPYTMETSTVEGVEVARMAYGYHDHRALADIVDNPRAVAVVQDWLRSARFDLVHAHHVTGFGAGVLEGIRQAGVPVVMTLHDYWFLCPRGQLVQPDGTVDDGPEPEMCARCLALTWPHLMPSGGGEARGPAGAAVASDVDAARERTAFALRCLEAPQRLFTPSEASKDVFVRAGVPAERVTVVPNGIEVYELTAQVRRLRAVHEGGPDPTGEIRLGVLGTVLPSKGCLELLRAFLDAAVPDLTIEIHGNLPSYHGDSSYVEEIRRLAARDPRIRVHGPYTHDRLAEILSTLDGVAAPSRWCEVFGLTVREARAAGLPVLVSDAGDLASVAAEGKAGVVVEVDDHKGWVQALRTFADYKWRAAWRRHDTRPRTSFDMMLQLEGAYVEVVREATGREPVLAHPAGDADGGEPRSGVLRQHGWRR